MKSESCGQWCRSVSFVAYQAYFRLSLSCCRKYRIMLHTDVLFCNPCLLIKSEKSYENILKQPEMNLKEKQQRTIENRDLNITDKGTVFDLISEHALISGPPFFFK